MRTSLAALICCLLVASLLGATAVAGAPSTADPGSDDAAATASSGVDAVVASDASAIDAVQSRLDAAQSEPANRTRPESIEIRIGADGDARFVLAKEFPTETDAQQRAFERLADEYERGEHGDLGFPAYEAAFETVESESGRSMELLDDGRHATRDGDVGRLEYRFTWTNFASVGEETVTIGDTFSANDSVWLELYEGQRLAIHAPDGYGVAASPPGPEIENDALVWTGSATFGPGDLDVTFDESAGGSSTVPTTVLFGLGLLILLGAVAVAVWWAVDRRSGDESLQDLIESVVPAAVTDAKGSASSSDVDNSSEGASDERAGAASDVEPAAAPEPAASEAAGDAVNPELLSDEERVEHLLEENGGRMKQATIVTETGWSNAKVSQLLSRMAEEERVDKLRIGRENLITLPDVDVTDQDEADS